MCHPEVPDGHQSPDVRREEISIPLSTGERMPAMAAYPDGESTGAVVVIPDVFGRSPFYEDLTSRLAAAGFNAVMVDFFFRQGPLPERALELAQARRRQLDENQTTKDCNDAVDWVKQQGAAGKRVGTIGFCMGGTQVLLLASDRNDVASVCYYGFPAKLGNATEKTAAAPMDRVDSTTGPIYGFWGDQDAGVGMPNVEAYRDALEKRGVDYKQEIYPGLGHGFLSASNLAPGNPGYDQACESWAKTLDFYRGNLN
jgi:carboxymethylenebutenolidase